MYDLPTLNHPKPGSSLSDICTFTIHIHGLRCRRSPVILILHDNQYRNRVGRTIISPMKGIGYNVLILTVSVPLYQVRAIHQGESSHVSMSGKILHPPIQSTRNQTLSGNQICLVKLNLPVSSLLWTASCGSVLAVQALTPAEPPIGEAPIRTVLQSTASNPPLSCQTKTAVSLSTQVCREQGPDICAMTAHSSPTIPARTQGTLRTVPYSL